MPASAAGSAVMIDEGIAPTMEVDHDSGQINQNDGAQQPETANRSRRVHVGLFWPTRGRRFAALRLVLVVPGEDLLEVAETDTRSRLESSVDLDLVQRSVCGECRTAKLHRVAWSASGAVGDAAERHARASGAPLGVGAAVLQRRQLQCRLVLRGLHRDADRWTPVFSLSHRRAQTWLEAGQVRRPTRLSVTWLRSRRCIAHACVRSMWTSSVGCPADCWARIAPRVSRGGIAQQVLLGRT